MKFEEFIKNNLARKAQPDKQLIKSLVNTAESDLKFLEKINLTEESARKLTTNYYDVLRSLIEAIASIKGYKIYSHEAFTYFLQELGENDISLKFDRLRKIRNNINYYGKSISTEEAKDIVSEIKTIINSLKLKYLENVS